MKDELSPQLEFSLRSLENPEGFWREQAEAIEWHKPFERACDFSNPPFAKWFPGGETNLCHNALDRHLAERGEQAAIVFLSSETGEERTLTYRELHREVNQKASVLESLGLEKGDRVVLKYPNHYATDGARTAVTGEIEQALITELGALARPAFIGLVRQLPKTRSGKVVRRALLAIAESRDAGDLSTLDDPQALDQIRESHALETLR